MTALQVELLETKLRVNNMAARMGINTRTTHVQTHISYQPSNKLRLQVRALYDALMMRRARHLLATAPQ